MKHILMTAVVIFNTSYASDNPDIKIEYNTYSKVISATCWIEKEDVYNYTAVTVRKTLNCNFVQYDTCEMERDNPNDTNFLMGSLGRVSGYYTTEIQQKIEEFEKEINKQKKEE